MRTASMRELLDAAAIFGDATPDDLDLLVGCCRNEVFGAGALLAHEGEPADRFFLVRRGRIATELHAPGGPLAVATAGVGDVVGWSWLFPPYRWTTDLRAVEPARVVAIEGLCLREKCESDPAFGFRMMMRFARLMIEQIDAMRLQLLDMYGGASAG